MEVVVHVFSMTYCNWISARASKLWMTRVISSNSLNKHLMRKIKMLMLTLLTKLKIESLR
jgi:hypothetical protein